MSLTENCRPDEKQQLKQGREIRVVQVSFEERSDYIFPAVTIIDGLIWKSFCANLIFIDDMKIL